MGRELSWHEEPARRSPQPDRGRRALARTSLDGVAAQRPKRPSRALAAGGSATTAGRRDLPETGAVVWRCLLSGPLSTRPAPPAGQRRGCPSRQGQRRGAPTRGARPCRGWPPPPTAANGEVHSGVGLRHRGLPGRWGGVGVGRRLTATRPHQSSARPPLPPLEAFFPPALARRVAASLRQSRHRWAVDRPRRARPPCDGRGQAHGRQVRRLVGATTCRLVRAAARTRWCLAPTQQPAALHRRGARPWSRQPCAPSPLDRVWACRQAGHEAGVCPRARCIVELAEHHEEPENARPSAA